MSLAGRLRLGLGAGGTAQRLSLFLAPSVVEPPGLRYFGIRVGESGVEDVVQSTSPTGLPIEVEVISTVERLDKAGLLQALDAIERDLIQGVWPPT